LASFIFVHSSLRFIFYFHLFTWSSRKSFSTSSSHRNLDPPNYLVTYFPKWSRAIAKAVSSRPPTVAVRVWARVRSCGICCGQSGIGAGFLRVLRFPLPIRIPPIVSQSPSPIIWGWYNRPVVAAVPSGLGLTPWGK
jgi:hypothetical protein